MSENKELQRVLTRRFIPLYIASFFQSFVLWYTIEKLFMRTIGFDNTTIGLMVAAYSAVMLAVEIPSGVWADRWSRSGILIIASVCLGLSGLIGGLSNSVEIYLVGSIFWGIFFACYSGMYESVVYDTIAETTEKGSKLFDYFYGRVTLMDGLGLILGGLIGAAIASATSLRVTYFVSIPFAAVSIFALIKFQEPTLHKKQAVIPFRDQFRATLLAIRNRALAPIIIVLIMRATASYLLYEFSQLWLIALNTPVKYYGLASAVLFSSLSVGGWLVGKKINNYNAAVYLLIITLLACLGLTLFKNIAAIIISQFVFGTGLISISVIFSRLLHDGLAPSIRAGASSAASTIGRFIIIPLSLLFGYISERSSIYESAYILIAITLTMAVFVLAVAGGKDRRGLESN